MIKFRRILNFCIVQKYCEERVCVVVRMDADDMELIKSSFHFNKDLWVCLAVHQMFLLFTLLFAHWVILLWNSAQWHQIMLLVEELQVFILLLANHLLEFSETHESKEPVQRSWLPVDFHFANFHSNKHVHILVLWRISLDLLDENLQTLFWL